MKRKATDREKLAARSFLSGVIYGAGMATFFLSYSKDWIGVAAGLGLAVVGFFMAWMAFKPASRPGTKEPF